MKAGRPPLERVVARLPRALLFKPAGVPARELEQVSLTVDEVEALRLVDLDGFNHEQAAASLGVSRQTVGRVLEAARRKVADALVNGKVLVIGGGVYQVAELRCCEACGTRWRRGEQETADTPGDACPACGSRVVRACVGSGMGRGGGRRRRGRGAGWGADWRCQPAPPTAEPRTGGDGDEEADETAIPDIT